MSCKLSPLESICMKCQILFPGKNESNISKYRPLVILSRALKRIIFAFHSDIHMPTNQMNV